VAVIRFSSREARLLGSTVAKLRVAGGLSQDKLAEKLNVSTRYVQKLEAGVHSPSLGLLTKLRKVLKIEWNLLMKDL
jgi:transcriptional regulator with XRE-family HTH domain